MSRNLAHLTEDFREQAVELLARCEDAGFVMKPFYTRRTPIEQAILWRQSRSYSTVVAKIKELQLEGAPFLAHCIEMVGPQHGRHVTNAIPGLSWHNHGEAIDCFHQTASGAAEWDAEHKAYLNYAETARSLGLTAGYFWQSCDAVHVQLRKESSPQKLYDLRTIDAIMKERFGHLV